MSLHPDLDALAGRYQQLYEAATEGHITPDDAVTTLASLSVTDGTGAVWKINERGEFTRAAFPGAPAESADPTSYVGPETVVSNPEIGAFNVGAQQAPTAPTWEPTAPAGGFGAPAPGFGTPAGGFGTPAAGSFGGQPSGPSPFDPVPGLAAEVPATSPFASPTFGTDAPGPTAPVFAPATERSLFDDHAHTRSAPVALTKVLETVKRHKFMVVIAALAVIFLSQRFLFGGEAGTKIPTKPATSTSATPTGEPSLPADPAASATTTPVTAQLPDGNAVNKVISALTDGDRDLISAQVAGNPDAGQVAHAAALFAGLKRAGLTLDTGATAPGSGPGTAVQTWKVSAGTTTVLTIPVTWSLHGSDWQLTTVPLPH